MIFELNDPVLDGHNPRYMGHVDDLRADGWVLVAWTTGRQEYAWVHERTLMLAPWFTRIRKPSR